MKITRNAVRCNYCGYVLESEHRHSFVGHTCGQAPAERWVHKRKWVANQLIELADMEPPSFYIDGGKDYLRRGGDQQHFTDISEYTE